MQKLGIEDIYVEGDVTVLQDAKLINAGHAWNVVRIDGDWHQIDVTWDDVYPRAFGVLLYPDDWEYELPISHAFFLISDEEMYQDHTQKNPFPLPECVDYGFFDRLNLNMTGTYEEIEDAFEDVLYENLSNDRYYIEIKINQRNLSTLDRYTLRDEMYPAILNVIAKLPGGSSLRVYSSSINWGDCLLIFFVPESEESAS